MPINFDWRNLQQYAMPALGIVSLLVSAIIVIVSGVGDEYVKSSSQGPSSDDDANVMFQVVDQTGYHASAMLYQPHLHMTPWLGTPHPSDITV